MSRENKIISFKVETKDVATNEAGQELGHIVCYGAVFNNKDEANDIIVPQAFKRTIRSAKDRASAREKKYIFPMLWNHSTEDIIGGWHTVTEDEYGLKCEGDINLATQRGKEYWSLAKGGFSDQFSIIYDVPQGGAKYDKSGTRELTEIRLFSIDPVTFACNDQTELVSVKSLDNLESKAICGNTSGEIGPRDESWDASKAEKQIWADAYDGDSGEIDKAKAKKYFMVCDGDGTEKGDYGYPFWYMEPEPHICVGAVKAIAGAVQGSRGATAPDGLKSKVETLYSRINKKYQDSPTLTPPWKDDEKSMNKRPKEMKTFAQHYAEEQCEDLLEDWQDVYVCALTQAIIDAFRVGDKPKEDIQEALNAFGEAVQKWADMGIEYGLSDFIATNINDEYSEPYHTIMYGSESRPNYGWMSRQTPMQRKAGRAISAANGDKLQSHIDSLHATADEHEKAMKSHIKAVHTVADNLASIIQGSKPNDDDPGTSDTGQQDGKKSASYHSRTRTPVEPPFSDTVPDEDIAAALASIKALRTQA